MQPANNTTGKALVELIFVGAEWRKPGEDVEMLGDKVSQQARPVDGSKRGFPGFYNSKKGGEAPATTY